MTRIEEDHPLNLWLANTRADLYAARLSAIELILNSDVSETAKLTQIRHEIAAVRRRQAAAMVEDTYEGQVGALTR